MEKASKSVSVTQEQIDQWKEKHTHVWAITVADVERELPEKTGYFRKPTRQELGSAMSAGKSNNIRMAEVLMKNIFLGGDRELIDNDDYFFGAVDKIEPLVEAPQSSIKKL